LSATDGEFRALVASRFLAGLEGAELIDLLQGIPPSTQTRKACVWPQARPRPSDADHQVPQGA
jgi:hypothetical protein